MPRGGGVVASVYDKRYMHDVKLSKFDSTIFFLRILYFSMEEELQISVFEYKNSKWLKHGYIYYTYTYTFETGRFILKKMLYKFNLRNNCYR